MPHEAIIEVVLIRAVFYTESGRFGIAPQLGGGVLSEMTRVARVFTDELIRVATQEQLDPFVERRRVGRLHEQDAGWAEQGPEETENVNRRNVEVLDHLRHYDDVIARKARSPAGSILGVIEVEREVSPGRRIVVRAEAERINSRTEGVVDEARELGGSDVEDTGVRAGNVAADRLQYKRVPFRVEGEIQIVRVCTEQITYHVPRSHGITTFA